MSADGAPAMTSPDGALLLRLARSAILEAFGGARAVVPGDAAWLHEKRAVFVTLHDAQHELRGCIGQVVARLPLHEAVRQAAKAAAFEDPRFPPVTEDEFKTLSLEVTLLTPLERMPCETEAEFLAQVRPGIDGVVLTHGFRSGLFIPQVWDQVADKADFLAHLKRKAGLPAAWQPGTKVERFTAVHWEEPPP